VALAILSPAFQGFETKSPADGKDRQRHNAGLPMEKTMWHYPIGPEHCPAKNIR
jgi:hypothetical protein